MTVWYLMDGRANFDIDAATVLELCDTKKEAYENINDYGADTCVVEVSDDGDEKLIWSLLWGQPATP